MDTNKNETLPSTTANQGGQPSEQRYERPTLTSSLNGGKQSFAVETVSENLSVTAQTELLVSKLHQIFLTGNLDAVESLQAESPAEKSSWNLAQTITASDEAKKQQLRQKLMMIVDTALAEGASPTDFTPQNSQIKSHRESISLSSALFRDLSGAKERLEQPVSFARKYSGVKSSEVS